MRFKKLIIPIIALVSLLPSVFARDIGSRMGQILYDLLGFLFIDYSSRIGGDFGLFYIRFLFWIGLFAALYYASSTFVFKSATKGVQITVPLVISLIGVIMIPSNVLIATAQSYGILFSVFLVGLPIIGLALLAHFAFNQDTPPMLIIKGAIYYIVGMMLLNLSVSPLSYIGSDIQDIIVIGAAICVFAAFINIGRGIARSFGWAGGAAAGGGGGWFDNWRNPDRPGYPAQLRAYFNQIGTLITRFNYVLSQLNREANTLLTEHSQAVAAGTQDRTANPDRWAEYQRISQEIDQVQTQIEETINQFLREPEFQNFTNRADQNRWLRILQQWNASTLALANQITNFNNRYDRAMGP